jgi:hypothetical protein
MWWLSGECDGSEGDEVAQGCVVVRSAKCAKVRRRSSGSDPGYTFTFSYTVFYEEILHREFLQCLTHEFRYMAFNSIPVKPTTVQCDNNSTMALNQT